jgi:penicillin-insensitive murein endopeptidase
MSRRAHRVFGLFTALALTQACASAWLDQGSRGRPGGGGGWIQGARRLPDRGTGYRVLRDDALGGQHWGAGRLVTMVQRLGRSVGGRGSVPLIVGDISARGGGQIPHHASHRGGRDVDLLFFAIDAVTGQRVVTPEFVRYDAAGDSVLWPVPLRFDTERNWDLVEAVVRADDVAVIRIFVARWIKQLLLDHARQRHRSAWVIERAEALLWQPGDSAPHDDHFHVRVACSPQERAHGCYDGGPLWSWLEKDWEKGDSAPADDATLLDALEPLTDVGRP